MWFALLIALVSAAAVPSPAARSPAQGREPLERPESSSDRTRFDSEEALRHYLAGLWLERTGAYQEAMNEYNRSLTLDPNARTVLVRVSETAARVGESQRSLEFAERALALEPGDARAQWLKGAALYTLGRTADALAPLEAAVLADSTRMEYWKTLARAGESLERLDVVERAYRRAVALDDDDAEAWFQWAAVLGRLGRFREADTALGRSLELNPIRPGAFFMRGWIREGTGKLDEAIDLYREHLRIHDTDQVTRRRLVTLLANRNRKLEAFAEAKKLAGARPHDGDVLLLVADLAYANDKPAEGARALARAREVAPDDADVLLRTIAVLARHERGREGMRLGDQWAAQHSDDPQAALLPARAFAVAGVYDSAAVRARVVVDAMPDSLQPRRLLARILQDGKRWKEAEREWSEVVRRDPGNPAAHLDLGFCREQAGDYPGAESAGRDALRIAPDLPAALNFLGYLIADHGGDLAEAEQLIQRALALDPDNGAFVDSLGWVLFRLGRLEDARRQLERALLLTGGDPTIHEHLGDVYVALSLVDLAREQYRLSLSDGEANRRVRGKLDALR